MERITSSAWTSLTECAAELGLSGPEFRALMAEVLAVPPDQVRGSLLTWGDYLAIVEKLEGVEGP